MKRRVLTFLCVAALARPAAAQTPILTIEFWRGPATRFEFGNVDTESAGLHAVPRGPVQHTVWILVNIGGTWYASRIPQPVPARVRPAMALASRDLVSAVEEVKRLDARAGK